MDPANVSLIKTLIIGAVIMAVLFPSFIGRDKNNNSKKKYNNEDMG